MLRVGDAVQVEVLRQEGGETGRCCDSSAAAEVAPAVTCAVGADWAVSGSEDEVTVQGVVTAMMAGFGWAVVPGGVERPLQPRQLCDGLMVPC